VLAEVLWPATTGAPTITSRAVYATAVGGVQRVESVSMLPTGLAQVRGQLVYDIQLGTYQAWNGAGWISFGALGAWTTATLTSLTQGVGVSGTNLVARYHKIGRQVTARVSASITSAGTGGTLFEVVTTGLPTPVTVPDTCVGTFTYEDSGSRYFTGTVLCPGANQWRLIAAEGAVLGTGSSPTNIAVASGDTFVLRLNYESAS
jgi:hypothetical protein